MQSSSNKIQISAKKSYFDFTCAVYGPPTAQQAAQSVLEQGMFVQLDGLWSKINLATRNAEGEVTWLALEPEYHKILVKTAITLVGQTMRGGCPVSSIKEALFSFLLLLINRRLQQSSFFEKEKAEALANRANRERKRLQRKRSRAAKREREREAAKIARSCESQPARQEVQPQQSAQTRKCDKCKKRFASRKKLSKHKCGSVAEEGSKRKEVTERQREARRVRRARAHKARRAKVAASKAAEQAAKKKQVIRARVTGSFGEFPTCEDCDEEAVGAVVHGTYGQERYPKCDTHGRHRNEFETFEEMFWKSTEKA